DFKEGTMELRLLMSARSSGQAFDLRCEVREQLIDFLQREHPEVLPHSRQIAFKSEAEAADESGPLGRKTVGTR
ncbi:MAG: mechanosensitive ion channel family protein, partial [Pseudolabrys sp.]